MFFCFFFTAENISVGELNTIVGTGAFNKMKSHCLHGSTYLQGTSKHVRIHNNSISNTDVRTVFFLHVHFCVAVHLHTSVYKSFTEHSHVCACTCKCRLLYAHVSIIPHYFHTTCVMHPCFPTPALTTELSHKEANHHQSD